MASKKKKTRLFVVNSGLHNSYEVVATFDGGVPELQWEGSEEEMENPEIYGTWTCWDFIAEQPVVSEACRIEYDRLFGPLDIGEYDEITPR